MSLKNKLIGAVLASALVAPPAFAVEGTDGMYYTSASEGFYASIRARFNTGETKHDNAAVVADAGSRFGLQGTGEMSHGLEGFYRYELSVPDVSGAGHSGLETSISFVGLRGGFGELRFGKWDLVEHDWVTARTDYANNGARPITWNLSNEQAIQYKSPDFNGLQVGAAFVFDGGNEYRKNDDGSFEDADPNADGIQYVNSNDNDLDAWTIAGNYAFNGFNLGGAYSTVPDSQINTAGNLEDANLWGISGSYGQDNWQVGTFYKSFNSSDDGVCGVNADNTPRNCEDSDYFSVAGQVDVGKTRVIVTHDTRDDDFGLTDAATTFEVEYRLNSKAKVWVGFTAADRDTDPNYEDDVYFGLRHDF